MPETRICKRCDTVLRMGNKGELCAVCLKKERDEPLNAKLDDSQNRKNLEAISTPSGESLEKEFYTPKELAALLGYSLRWVRKKVKREEIKVISFAHGRKQFVRKEEVARLLGLEKGAASFVIPPRLHDDLQAAFTTLTAAMEILKSPTKNFNDMDRAVRMLGLIPFRRDTARLYGLFVGPDEVLLTDGEKAEALEGFNLIYRRNRHREDPISAHLAQRSVYWMARSHENKFAMSVKGLYQSENIPFVRRGMMMGLIFAGLIDPEEYSKTFLNEETNQLLDILIYQMRCKDIPHDLAALVAKDVEIGRNFSRTFSVLMKELGDLAHQPTRLCSLRTLNNVLAFGRDNALADFKKILSLEGNRAMLNGLISQNEGGAMWKADILKLKRWIKDKQLIKNLQAMPRGSAIA